MLVKRTSCYGRCCVWFQWSYQFMLVKKDKLLRPLLCVVPVELSVHAGEEGQVVTAVVVCGSSGAISSCW